MSKNKISNEDELFEEARRESIAKNIIENEEPEKPATLESHYPAIKERIQEGETQWDLLRRMIDGGMTERFIGIMKNMPDKDYARTYLKLLEHFKPKITRAENLGETENDKTVNIVMHILNTDGLGETIDISHLEETDENEE